MRAAKLLLLILPCFLVSASADPLPSLVWGDLSIIGSPSGAFVDASDTGVAINYSCVGPVDGCDVGFEFVRSFTVTSPGTFVASGSLTDKIGGDDDCGPIPCVQPLTAGGSFSVTGAFISLSDSGSTSHDTGCLSGECVGLSLSDAESTAITLGVGQHFFVEDVSESEDASGFNSVSLNGTFNIVPTPEPRWGLAVIALVFLIPLRRRAT